MNHSVVRHCRAAATSFVLAAAAFAAAAPAAADALVDRSYPVLPTIQEAHLQSVDPDYDPNPNAPWRLSTGPTTPPLTSFEDWFRGYTAERGVSWPEGSSLAYSPLLGRIDVRNTEANHALFRRVVARWQRQQIRVSLQFASAAPAAFRELGLEDALGTSLSPEEWSALRARLAEHQGVELRDCPTVLSHPGTTDMAKGVSEVLYPTEFAVEPFRGADGKTGVRVEPQEFNTRFVGCIAQVTPNVSSEQWLSLELTPAAVYPPSWRDFAGPGSPVAGSLRQPFFPVFSLATIAALHDGRTLVFGGAVVDEPDKGPRVQLLFVSAERVLLDGGPLPFAVPVEEPTPPDLETRRFLILPTVWELAVLDAGGEPFSVTNVVPYLRKLAGHAGVDWPDGSFVRFDQIDWTAVVRNTPENLDRFRRALVRERLVPFQFRVRTRFLSATPEAFEALSLFGTLGGSFSPDDWAALRAKLDATPGVETRAWPTLLAQTGFTVTIKGVTEFVYPTEYEVKPLVLVDNGTNAPPVMDWSVAAVEPQEFNTREVGQIVQLTPTLSSDGGRVSVDLTSSLVLPPVWKDYAAPGFGAMEQPFFPDFSAATSLDLLPGYTVLLGGAIVDDPATGRHHEFFAIGVDLVGLDGEPLEHPATP